MSFQELARAGGVASDEMFRVFNMGVGMILIVRPEEADGIVSRLEAGGEQAWHLGEIHTGDGVTLA